ncbi:MAG TPA: protein translocase subunit SecF [Euryarchaeota archaeon]|nr:protein translocase subunit SecF [Euryarchaeota archaeon]
MTHSSVLDKFIALDTKKLMIITILMLVASLTIVVVSYSSGTMPMSISFKGGTLLTASFTGEYPAGLQSEMSSAINYNVKARVVTSALGNKEIEVFVDSPLNNSDITLIENVLGEKGISKKGIAYNTIQPSLGTQFFKQAMYALLFAFILMALTVFFRFKTAVPSFAVVLSAFSDIVVTLAVMGLLGIELSKGSLVALLLLIGYSVDTDILLTTRVLVKKKEPLHERIKKSMKTGLTMSITTFSAMFVLYIISSSKILDDVAAVIMIGMIADMLNTWIQNVAILKWYLERVHR